MREIDGPVQAQGGKMFAGFAKQAAGLRKTEVLPRALTGEATAAG
jgi:hypothetical protein